MPERKIRPVTDGFDKKVTYKTQFERYDKAVKNGFYFEAMLIVYAIIEDRLRAWLFYLGCLNTRQSTRFDNKRSKNELKFMFDECEDNKFRFPSINQISGKRKIIEATLTWAENGYNNADKSNYLCAIRKLSPVSQKELIDYIYLEYGFEKNTTASKLSVISKYCHNGVYNVDYKKMPENRLQIMKNNLNEPFYYFDEVKDKYSLLFANADRDEINPYTLKKMGFHVLSKYILSEKYESLREYFIDLLTKNDVIKISDFTRRYTNVQMYYQTLSELKKSYKIIQADADTYISFRKLEEKGIALDDIHEFCNKVYATVNDGEYFTIHSIRSYGFTDIFENAGFGEYLCSALLACDSRFDSQSIFLSIVLSKNNEIGQISKKSFIKSCLSENVPCSPKKLIESVYNKYGVRITDKYEITEAIKNSNFCYDDIIDEIYAIE